MGPPRRDLGHRHALAFLLGLEGLAPLRAR
jgi:hypothetical protein